MLTERKYRLINSAFAVKDCSLKVASIICLQLGWEVAPNVFATRGRVPIRGFGGLHQASTTGQRALLVTRLLTGLRGPADGRAATSAAPPTIRTS